MSHFLECGPYAANTRLVKDLFLGFTVPTIDVGKREA